MRPLLSENINIAVTKVHNDLQEVASIVGCIPAGHAIKLILFITLLQFSQWDD